MNQIKDNKKEVLVTAGVFVMAVIVVFMGVFIGYKLGSKASDRIHKNEETEQENPPEEYGTVTDTAVDADREDTGQETVTSEAVGNSAPIQNPVVYPEEEGPRKAYLTFDDGTSEQTDRILDILAQYGVKATFFVTARSGEANAARYRRIVAEGHSIGLHSVTHDYKQIYSSLDAYIADVEGIRQFVFNITGVDSRLYRFPGGSSNSVANIPLEDCIRYLNRNGYRYYDWNIDTSDSVNNEKSVDEVVSRALGEAVDKYHNCVILMHDSGSQDHTVAALPRIIEGLQARGMEILPITDNTPLVQHKKAASVQ